jgi:hypothetical protein
MSPEEKGQMVESDDREVGRSRKMASTRKKREKWTRSHTLSVLGIAVAVVLTALTLWLRRGPAAGDALLVQNDGGNQRVTNRGGDGGSIVIQQPIRAGDGGANGAPGGSVNIRAGDGAPAVSNQRAGDGGSIEIRGRDGAPAN